MFLNPFLRAIVTAMCLFSIHVILLHGSTAGNLAAMTFHSERPNRIFLINTKLTDPCLRQQVENAISVDVINEVTNLVNTKFAMNDKINLNISEHTMAGNVDAQTGGQPFGTGTLVINVVLNQTTLPSKTQEYIVATLYHELLHAVLWANGKRSSQHHTIMANQYMSVLSSALMSYFPSMPRLHAEALTWGGLQETGPWNNLSTFTRSNFGAINTAYGNRSLGIPCGEQK